MPLPAATFESVAVLQLESLVRGTFDLPCRDILLARKGSRPLAMHGPGQIRQEASGQLVAVLRAERGYIIPILNELTHPVAAGQLMAEEDYFQMTAEDAGGNMLHGRATRVDYVGDLAGGGEIRAPLLILESVEARPGLGAAEFARALLHGNLLFPKVSRTEVETRRDGRPPSWRSSWDHATFRAGEEEFSLFEGAGHTVFECSLTPGGLAAFRHVRMTEALQFALGQVVWPFAWETQRDGKRTTRIRSPDLKASIGNGVPPLLFGADPANREPYRIAEAYYLATVSRTQEEWHPLSGPVYQVIDASTASIDLRALAYAVAVESAVGLCFEGLDQPAAGFLAEVDLVLAALPKLELQESTRARLAGALQAMKHPRNTDRLKSFIAAQNLDPGLYATWSKMRNAVAHGLENSAEMDVQWAALNKVLYLFHSLVLTYIGYSGRRTDYSTVGLPEAPWPVPPTTAPTVLPTVPA